uniref:Uncharacterized protein n=1 Tax=Zea mays TaxID=4577 RepID=A0A804P093_MAIZE
MDALNRVATVASRLGRRCAAPALAGFGHVYVDLLASRADAGALAAVASRSDAAPLVRRLDRVAAATAALYAELDALAELEQSTRRPPPDQARRALEQRAVASPRRAPAQGRVTLELDLRQGRAPARARRVRHLRPQPPRVRRPRSGARLAGHDPGVGAMRANPAALQSGGSRFSPRTPKQSQRW